MAILRRLATESARWRLPCFRIRFGDPLTRDMATDPRIFQIFYDEATRLALDPCFEPLDNSRNERPDWFEYWPIRAFLRNNALDDDSFYGFLSPRFKEKTWLDGETVRAFVRAAGNCDVVTFSPTPDYACFYFNVFEQGENYHPGLLEISQAFFDEIELNVALRRVVMDTRTSVFGNFFVAKGSFWRRWSLILDKCFEHAEKPASPLHRRLCAPAEYYRPVQMKILLMERVASVMLATSNGIAIRNYPPFKLPLLEQHWIPLFDNLVAMDAMKIAHLETGDEVYLGAFRAMQTALAQRVNRQPRVK